MRQDKVVYHFHSNDSLYHGFFQLPEAQLHAAFTRMEQQSIKFHQYGVHCLTSGKWILSFRVFPVEKFNYSVGHPVKTTLGYNIIIKAPATWQAESQQHATPLVKLDSSWVEGVHTTATFLCSSLQRFSVVVNKSTCLSQHWKDEIMRKLQRHHRLCGGIIKIENTNYLTFL